MNRKEKSPVYVPAYYERFRCAADRCRHSCCVDWEITVDALTLEKYRQIGGGLMETVRFCNEEACFRLDENGKCPHLNERGLCNIILEHGEDCLTDICRLHPRFFHLLGEGRMEAGLGIACEEACRLVLTDTTPFSLSLTEAVGVPYPSEGTTVLQDALVQREELIRLIETESMDFSECLDRLREQYAIPSVYTIDGWCERFLELDILDSQWKKRLQSSGKRCEETADRAFEAYYRRLLIYFVYRHVSSAASEANRRARLGFALLSTEMIRHLFQSQGELTLEALVEVARCYSAEIEYSEDNTAELIFEFESMV